MKDALLVAAGEAWAITAIVLQTVLVTAMMPMAALAWLVYGEEQTK